MQKVKLDLISAGCDIGNGRAKLTIAGKSASIPAAYSQSEPDLPNSGNYFSIILDNSEYFFGPDILINEPIRELDEFKYDPDYLRIIFSGLLAKWAKLYGSKLLEQNRLHVVTGMPPGQHKNSDLKRKAQLAYRKSLSNGLTTTDGKKTPKNWHIRARFNGRREVSFPVYSDFAALAVEGEVLKETTTLDKGITVVLDGGQGTVDVVVFETKIVSEKDASGKAKRVEKTRVINSASLNKGLLHAYAKINPTNPGLIELDYLTNGNTSSELDGYLNALKQFLGTIVRQLRQQNYAICNLIIFGGANELMSPTYINSLKRVFASVEQRGEFANADCYAIVSEKLIKDQQRNKR